MGGQLGRCFIRAMKLEAYIITWNREDTIHLTIGHYHSLGFKVILYDNFSIDRTREIAEELGADVRLFGTAGVLDDGVYLDIKNHAWKRSTADWVFVGDDDEILYHPQFGEVLQRSERERVTIFKPRGFSVYSEQMPKESFLDIQTGFWDEKYSKLCLFNPSKVSDIGYIEGCHAVRRGYPKGQLTFSEDMYLLHYHGIGGAERMIARHKLYAERLSERNRRWGLGKEYGDTPQSKRVWFKEHMEKSFTFPKGA